MSKQVRAYKVNSLSNLKPDSIVALKVQGEQKFELYVTDLQGVPYTLNSITGGGGGIQTITNSDGNISIDGTENLVINISPSLLSLINSALQSGDNISELVNDAGYITTSSLPINTSELINDGSDGTSTYVENDELGAVATSNDYNDLDNLPTIVNDKNYVHNQGTAASTWTVNHNLNKYPSATMVLSNGQKGYGDITYIDENNLTITFASAESGKAYIN